MRPNLSSVDRLEVGICGDCTQAKRGEEEGGGSHQVVPHHQRRVRADLIRSDGLTFEGQQLRWDQE